jgi:hypothetical protein
MHGWLEKRLLLFLKKRKEKRLLLADTAPYALSGCVCAEPSQPRCDGHGIPPPSVRPHDVYCNYYHQARHLHAAPARCWLVQADRQPAPACSRAQANQLLLAVTKRDEKGKCR